MKNLRSKTILLIIVSVFALMLSACGLNGGQAGSEGIPNDPNAMTQPDYQNAEDPVKALILYSFSNAEKTSHIVRANDDQSTVSSKILWDLLDFAALEETSETAAGEPEMIIDFGEMDLELYGNLVKAQHLDVDWPTKLDFDFKWYRITEEADRKVHEWLKTATFDNFAFIGGTKIYKFVDQESEILRLKKAQPAKIIIHESDAAAVTESTVRDEQDIDSLMQAFRDLRVMEETEKPEGTEHLVTFVLEDSSQVQVRFINECLEYGGKFYTLWTGMGFFMEIDRITKGQ